MTSLQKGTYSLPEYIRRFMAICDDLAAIGKTVLDKNKVFWLLEGLGSKYETFVTTMLKPHVPSYSAIVPMLQSHEARIKRNGGNTQPKMAYMAQKGWNQNRNNWNHNKKGNHQWQKSFDLRGKGFIQGENSNVNKASGGPNSVAGNETSKGGFQQGIFKENQKSHGSNEATKDVPICQVCGKRGHTVLKCYNRFNHSFQAEDIPKALAAMTIADNQDSAWFLDTRATAHMTSHVGKLFNLQPYKGRDGVMGDLHSYNEWLDPIATHLEESSPQTNHIPSSSQCSVGDTKVDPTIRFMLNNSRPAALIEQSRCEVLDDSFNNSSLDASTLQNSTHTLESVALPGPAINNSTPYLKITLISMVDLHPYHLYCSQMINTLPIQSHL
ncbi:hypothetical protein Patl1_32909 [Pistacia atlantica]|uniref:Uncharacterized protein n=1 Tax=Pistacia atlantica TaxID=434234 RepID=A0ACC1AMG8_9ROSI|nr:hypothetical protein Patl1_32909 [Pistacia atlantica]